MPRHKTLLTHPNQPPPLPPYLSYPITPAIARFHQYPIQVDSATTSAPEPIPRIPPLPNSIMHLPELAI